MRLSIAIKARRRRRLTAPGGAGGGPAVPYTFAGVTGINIAPPADNWRAASLGMTTDRRDALLAAGFDTVRIWLDLDGMMDATAGAPRDAEIAAGVARVAEAVADGFRVVVAFASAYQTLVDICDTDSADYTAFEGIAVAIANGIEAHGGAVALQLMNEPPGGVSYSTDFAPTSYAAVRAAAPRLPIIVSAEGAWPGHIDEFDPADFDPHAIFAIHGYDPGPLTHQHQAAYKHIGPLPYPVTRFPGGEAAAISAMEDRVDADGTLDSGQKAALIASNTAAIEGLFTWHGGERSRIVGLLDGVDDWLTANSVSPSRILVTEFGFIGEDHWDGEIPGLVGNIGDRARFEQDWREEIAARGYGGWTVYQALGDFPHFAQTGATDADADTLEPDLLAALGLAETDVAGGEDSIVVTSLAALPPVILSVGVETIVVTAADGGTHDRSVWYREGDGGLWTRATGETPITITGLTGGAVYEVDDGWGILEVTPDESGIVIERIG